VRLEVLIKSSKVNVAVRGKGGEDLTGIRRALMEGGLRVLESHQEVNVNPPCRKCFMLQQA
jgi:hypothetical protein